MYVTVMEDLAVVIVNLIQRRVHRSGTDSRRGEGRESFYLTRYTVTIRTVGSDVSHVN